MFLNRKKKVHYRLDRRKAMHLHLTFSLKISMSILIVTLLTSAFAGYSQADEIVYKPTNPSFGGNPFNGPYLLSNATAQRQHDAPDPDRPSALETFSDTIERGLLNRISREIGEAILGEDAKDSGTFTVGDTTLDFHREGNQVIINVQDLQTGESTTIELPVPQY
jgi:curli production assembly/transport component CsgF